MRVGVHVSIAGGLLEAVKRAQRLSCRTMQIFSRSPRGGPASTFTNDDLQAFHQQRRRADIEPLIVHGPYIINLASPDRTVFARSVALYQQEYRRCQLLQARYLVTHVGSHKGEGEEAGVKRVAEAVNRTLEAVASPAQSDQSPVMIVLENTAGSGQGLGYAFEHLAAMRDLVEDKLRVGICLDTAHLFAAGFPIHTADGLDETLDQFDRTVGFEHLRVAHLNDSKSAFNSRTDRHWHIGQGQIGLDAMARIINHPRLREVPFILETPKDSEEDDRRNLATVARLLGDGETVSSPVR